jgi:hypothetical protein
MTPVAMRDCSATIRFDMVKRGTPAPTDEKEPPATPMTSQRMLRLKTLKTSYPPYLNIFRVGFDQISRCFGLTITARVYCPCCLRHQEWFG